MSTEGPEEGELETPQEELNESEFFLLLVWTGSNSIK